jgi:hypothetical protein
MMEERLNGIIMWTDASKFESIRNVLKTEFGLVAPTGKDWSEKEVLVYERPKGNGIYRVHLITNHRLGPYISFEYWEHALKKEECDDDPIKTTIKRIYGLLKPVKVTNAGIKEINLDKILK